MFIVEPIGDGVVDSTRINWANKNNFATTVANNGMNPGWNGTRYNDGLLFDDDGTRTGTNSPWGSGSYAQIDLKQPRRIDTVILLWDYVWNGANFNVSYSTDGASFTSALKLAGPFNYGTGGFGATEVQFDPVKTRYVRVANLSGGNNLNLFNQMLVLGAGSVPGTIILLR